MPAEPQGQGRHPELSSEGRERDGFLGRGTARTKARRWAGMGWDGGKAARAGRGEGARSSKMTQSSGQAERVEQSLEGHGDKFEPSSLQETGLCICFQESANSTSVYLRTAVCVTLSGQGGSRCLCVSFLPRPPEPQLEQELRGLRVGSDCTIKRAHLLYLTN